MAAYYDGASLRTDSGVSWTSHPAGPVIRSGGGVVTSIAHAFAVGNSFTCVVWRGERTSNDIGCDRFEGPVSSAEKLMHCGYAARTVAKYRWTSALRCSL